MKEPTAVTSPASLHTCLPHIRWYRIHRELQYAAKFSLVYAIPASVYRTELALSNASIAAGSEPLCSVATARASSEQDS